jgi:hypothetical protein
MARTNAYLQVLPSPDVIGALYTEHAITAIFFVLLVLLYYYSEIIFTEVLIIYDGAFLSTPIKYSSISVHVILSLWINKNACCYYFLAKGCQAIIKRTDASHWLISDNIHCIYHLQAPMSIFCEVDYLFLLPSC